MPEYLFILFLLPFAAAAGIMGSERSTPFIVYLASASLMGASVLAWLSFESPHTFSAPWLDIPFLLADGAVAGYFAHIGWQHRHKRIFFLSIVQLGLLSFLEYFSAPSGNDIVVDRLSLFMFMLINVAGSAILLYALRYIRDETSDPFRQRLFLSMLCVFIGVMNLLVSSDNLEWLFLFFELTTLASFWLIGFRRNEESLENARTALWMNQIGGVSLLVAAIIAKAWVGSVYLSEIVASEGGEVMLFASFFAIASLIKGAQLPFSGWLLGAMVAPAPVSAILHSSTMVKIAPYLLLKISPILSLTMLGWVIALIGGVSFLVAAALALREDNFKKILAYSTVSLLGLMILTAALATPLSVLASLLLILFHGISKALLFMCAGILEKHYAIHTVESLYGLSRRAPFLTSLTVLGLVSIALPPFGVFFAKWIVYEGGSGIGGSTSVVLLLLIAVGSVALSLLYFKTLGRFIAEDPVPRQKEEFLYLAPAAVLGIMLIAAALFASPLIGGFFKETASSVVMNHVPVWGDMGGIILPFGKIEFWHIAAAFFLLGVLPLIAAVFPLRGVDRATPYTCGERTETDAYAFYFDPIGKLMPALNLFALGLFVLIIVVGALKL